MEINTQPEFVVDDPRPSADAYEFTDRGFVRRCFCAEVDPDKFAHGIAVVKAIFRLRIRQIEPLLKELDPQHSLYADGRTASLARGIMGLGQAAQLPPRDDSVHLAQEALSLSPYHETSLKDLQPFHEAIYDTFQN